MIYLVILASFHPQQKLQTNSIDPIQIGVISLIDSPHKSLVYTEIYEVFFVFCLSTNREKPLKMRNMTK